MLRTLIRRCSVLAVVALLGAQIVAPPVAAGTSQTYIVLSNSGKEAALVAAIKQAGGTLVTVNSKVGVASATGDAAFADRLAASRAIGGVARSAAFRIQAPAAAEAATQFPSVEQQVTGCANQYQPPGGTGVGPDPLSVCQWDMRIINASSTGSYAVNRGRGARIGIIDTGVDLTHPDIAPNLDVASSCSFIRPTTPTSLPQEWETTANCTTKSAVQDYAGHGTHVAGEAAAPINGIGVAGVAPEATIVGLKAGTAGGYFFTQEVVDALVYAGDQRLDVVNMSFFADPFLFNCHNDKEQQTIFKAISRAAQYALNRKVVLIAAAGNEAFDLDHPVEDPISPDYPPGAAVPRPVGNNCVVLPTELPGVGTISAIGPQRTLSFYSNYSNSKVDVTGPGGDSLQAPNPFGRVLNAWSSTAPFTAGGNPSRTVEDCTGTVCVYYAWIQGTSMASPHATGVAALIRAANPGLPPQAVVARLQNTAMGMYCPPDPRCSGQGTGTNPQTNFYGNGLIDALAAGSGHAGN